MTLLREPHALSSGELQIDLTLHLRAYRAFNELQDLLTVTSLRYVLPHIEGGEHVLETLTHAKNMLHESKHLNNTMPDAVLGAQVIARLGIISVLESFIHAGIIPSIKTMKGGRLILTSLEHLQELLPYFSIPSADNDIEHLLNFELTDGDLDDPLPAPERVSIISKESEVEKLREEIPQQLTLQQNLFLAMFYGSIPLLSLSLQPGVSGLTAMILPIAGFALVLKIAGHDLRVGQIGYILRRVLCSPYEITRRVLFDQSKPSPLEQRVIQEQHIDITSDMLQETRQLKPALPGLQVLGNRLGFMTFDIPAVGIAVLRTYSDVLHLNMLTIFTWLLGITATVLTWLILERKRIR